MHHPCKPCPPPRPAPCSQGVLLPRIIAHENRCIPRLCTQLCLKGLPECTCPPLCLRLLAIPRLGLALAEAEDCVLLPE